MGNRPTCVEIDGGGPIVAEDGARGLLVHTLPRPWGIARFAAPQCQRRTKGRERELEEEPHRARADPRAREP